MITLDEQQLNINDDRDPFKIKPIKTFRNDEKVFLFEDGISLTELYWLSCCS